ncbi:ropporin-1-like protein [Neosynchiropus ocellatus]
MPLPDTIYCSEQINVPPGLTDILKNFTKAAIRAQPSDLLWWSAEYFRALSTGEPLPGGDRLGTKVSIPRAGLTPALLKTLNKQFSDAPCSKEDLQKSWTDLCLSEEQLGTLLSLGGFSSDIEWLDFFALGCSSLGGTLMASLKSACEILTEDEDGGSATIPFDTFTRLYTYLAKLDGDIPQDQMDNFISTLKKKADLQQGMIKPNDFINLEHTDLIATDEPNRTEGVKADEEQGS